MSKRTQTLRIGETRGYVPEILPRPNDAKEAQTKPEKKKVQKDGKGRPVVAG